MDTGLRQRPNDSNSLSTERPPKRHKPSPAWNQVGSDSRQIDSPRLVAEPSRKRPHVHGSRAFLFEAFSELDWKEESERRQHKSAQAALVSAYRQRNHRTLYDEEKAPMSVQMAPRPVPYEEELTREAVWNKSPKPAPRQSQRLSERHPDSPLLATQLLPPPTSSGLKVSMLQASAPGGVAGGAGMDAHLRARTFEQRVEARIKWLMKSHKNQHKTALDISRECDVTDLTDKDPLTLKWVTRLMDEFKLGRVLSYQSTMQLLRRMFSVLTALPNIVSVTIQPHCRMTVVGDLHGQLEDLLTIFKLNGLPTVHNMFLFNGDFVDRGKNSCEVLLVLLCFKLLYPTAVFLNRGNHESRDMNSQDGFEKEVLEKYDYRVFDTVSEMFSCLPLGTVVNDRILVVHGGLFWDDATTLDDVQQEDRMHEVLPDDSIMEQMLWSDPCDQPGRYLSQRGAGLNFGADVVKRFLDVHKLELIIRSHECVDEGYECLFDNTLVTLFSASNYCGVCGNKGAVCIITEAAERRFVQYMAKPIEDMGMHNMHQDLLESDVICKLLKRITAHRQELLRYFRRLRETRQHTVTRTQWDQGLKTVLGLNLDFLRFQSWLGLPELGVNGQRHGPINYHTFLSRFRPVLSIAGMPSLDDSSETSDSGADLGDTVPTGLAQPARSTLISNTEPASSVENPDSEAATLRTSSASDILEMLSKDKQPVASSGRVGGNSVTLEDQGHARPSKPKDRAVLKVFREATNLMFIHKPEMESLFRQFDLDGSGAISKGDLRDALVSLAEVFNHNWPDTAVDSVVEIMAPATTTVQYMEFLRQFGTASPPIPPAVRAEVVSSRDAEQRGT